VPSTETAPVTPTSMPSRPWRISGTTTGGSTRRRIRSASTPCAS